MAATLRAPWEATEGLGDAGIAANNKRQKKRQQGATRRHPHLRCIYTLSLQEQQPQALQQESTEQGDVRGPLLSPGIYMRDEGPPKAPATPEGSSDVIHHDGLLLLMEPFRV